MIESNREPLTGQESDDLILLPGPELHHFLLPQEADSLVMKNVKDVLSKNQSTMSIARLVATSEIDLVMGDSEVACDTHQQNNILL